jgi:hypothetical protein
VFVASQDVEHLTVQVARREFVTHVAALPQPKQAMPRLLSWGRSRPSADATELALVDGSTITLPPALTSASPIELVGVWKYAAERGSKKRFLLAYGVPALAVAPFLTKAPMSFTQRTLPHGHGSVLARHFGDDVDGGEDFAGIDFGTNAGQHYTLEHEVTGHTVHETTTWKRGVLSVRARCDTFASGEMLVTWHLTDDRRTLIEAGGFGGTTYYARFFARVGTSVHGAHGAWV